MVFRTALLASVLALSSLSVMAQIAPVILNNPTITGGSINGTTIGATTPATASFTPSIIINPAAANPLTISNTTIQATGAGNASLIYRTVGNGGHNFFTEGGSAQVLQLNDQTSAVSYMRLQPGISGNGPTFSAINDTTANININPGTTGAVRLSQNSGTGAVINGMVQYGKSQTYVNTAGILNIGPNYPGIWNNVNLSGAMGAGASTYNFFNMNDTVSSPTAGLYAFGITHTLNAGWDGLRQDLNVKITATAASGGSGQVNGPGFFTRYGDSTHQFNEAAQARTRRYQRTGREATRSA